MPRNLFTFVIGLTLIVGGLAVGLLTTSPAPFVLTIPAIIIGVYLVV